ncbi:hypothetical protein [Nocardia salmonicida]|uniref:hypothetical protein n=1 Tax=Nocardia salmonicida TaxID=53431 RepID=UPI0033D9599E
MKPLLTTVMAAVLAAATAATGCSKYDARVVEPGCRADPFPPPDSAVPPCSAPDVLRAAVSTLYELDPVVGLDARSMFEAARPLMRAAYTTDTRVGVSMWAPITVGDWQDWVSRHVALSTEVRLSGDDDHPPDTATSTSRLLSVTISPADQPPIVFVVSARATRQTSVSAWLLADVQVLA